MSAEDFPTISRPLARGASRCHVLAVQPALATMIAACGTACGNFCGDASYEDRMRVCPEHGEPLCPDCREIMQSFLESGEWEGEHGDPETFGIRLTVCLEPDCPETIPIGPCWCWEHINTCREPDCPHGAHYCEAPVHYCDRHAARDQ